MTSTPTHDEELERYFEANFLDGDKLQKGQLVSALDVIEFIKAREKLIREQADIEERALRWALSDDTGISSKTLCAFMLGFNETNGARGWGRSYPPSDADDRDRCITLLKHIPEWLPRLSELAEANPGGNWNPDRPNTPVKSSWAYQIPLIIKEGGFNLNSSKTKLKKGG